MVLQHLSSVRRSCLNMIVSLIAFLCVICSSSHAVAQTQSVEEQYQAAKEYLSIGGSDNITAAKEILTPLLAKYPFSAPLLVEMARYHIKSESPDGVKRAENLLLKAVSKEPEYAEGRLLLGYVYTLQGLYVEAEEQYADAEQLGTDNLWLYANRGLNYQLQQKVHAALDMYLLAVETPSENTSTFQVRKWIYDSSDLFALLLIDQQFEQAVRHYDKYAKLVPSQPCVCQLKASILLHHLDKPRESIKSYSAAQDAGCTAKNATAALAYYLLWHRGLETGSAFAQLKSDYISAQSYAVDDASLLFAASLSPNTAALMPALIHEGKQINAVASDGMTALLYSVAAKNLGSAHRLLQLGADVNQASGQDGLMPLLLAVYTNDAHMVQLLLDAGADPLAPLPNEMSILEFTIFQGAHNLVNLMKRY